MHLDCIVFAGIAECGRYAAFGMLQAVMKRG